MDEFFTPREFATMVRRSLLTVQRWRKAGHGPRWVRIEGRILYPRRDLAKWFLARDSEEVSIQENRAGGKEKL